MSGEFEAFCRCTPWVLHEPNLVNQMPHLSVLQNNQADLENATEVLSGYLERDISQDSLQDIKQKVQDKYR